MASIREVERADGRTAYTVLFRLDGKQTSETVEDEKTALRIKRMVASLGPAETRRIIRAGQDKPTLAPTLEESLQYYLAHSPHTTKGTRGEYQRVANRSWLPSLGQLPVDAITADVVRRWVGQQAETITVRGAPTSVKTLANQHGLLFAVLERAVEQGHVPANPCRHVKLPKGQREEMTVLTHNEYVLLLHQFPERWKTFVQFLVGTGLRFGEATALRWGEVDLDSGNPSVRVVNAWKRGATGARVHGEPKSSRSRRTVTLGVVLAGELRAARPRDPDPKSLVFTAVRGGVIHHQHFHPRVWTPAVAAFAGDRVDEHGAVVRGHGKRPRPHDLRHMHASWLLSAGEPPLKVQFRLGHESLETTSRVYGHLTPDGYGTAAITMDEILSQARPEIVTFAPAAVEA